MIDKYKYQGDHSFRIGEFNSHPIKDYSKKESKDKVKNNVKAISEIQERLFAEKKRSVLIVFQATDAAGKDGTIKRLVTGLNAAGVEVNSFKKPTDIELAHDYLWRVHNKVPAKGMIGIFNRSHYEEVLVTKVHPSFIVYQNIPGINSKEDIKREFWDARYEGIKAFEKNLAENGTIIMKFFLCVSKDEQKRRLISRIEDPEKHYKFNLTDTKEREHWESYENCFEDMINKTSQPEAPWYTIPADDKNYMRVMVTQKVLEELQKHDIQFPSFQGDFEEESKEAMAMLNAD